MYSRGYSKCILKAFCICFESISKCISVIFGRRFEGEVQSVFKVSLMVFITIVEGILNGIANVFEATGVC